MKRRSRIRAMRMFLVSAALAIPIQVYASDVALFCGDFVGGFVRDHGGRPLENATIVLTDRQRKLFTLQSGPGGWFETPVSLTEAKAVDGMNLVAMKRGYLPGSTPISRQEECVARTGNTPLVIQLAPIEDYLAEEEHDSLPLDVLYGYVFDEKTGQPVRGALVTISEENAALPVAVSRATTRESGFFSLYYEPRDEADTRSLLLSVSHESYTKRASLVDVGSASRFVELGLGQVQHSFSVGFGWHFQSTAKQSDKESGGAASINLAWYPGGLLLLDRESNRYRRRTGVVGWDFSVGIIPYAEEGPGEDEIKRVYTYGVGAVLNFSSHSSVPIQVRAGLTTSNTRREAIYIGASVPLYFF